jgi:hypothetical protein
MAFRYSMKNFPAVKDRIAKLGRPLDRAEAKELGDRVVAVMKERISRGFPPIRGGGFPTRFAKYKNPDKYPGKKKAHTPVNLHLKGKFLEALVHKVISRKDGYATQIYYADGQDVKEKGHRLGANGQPKRPTIPAASNGERFVAEIEDVYLEISRRAFSRR